MINLENTMLKRERVNLHSDTSDSVAEMWGFAMLWDIERLKSRGVFEYWRGVPREAA